MVYIGNFTVYWSRVEIVSCSSLPKASSTGNLYLSISKFTCCKLGWGILAWVLLVCQNQDLSQARRILSLMGIIMWTVDSLGVDKGVRRSNRKQRVNTCWRYLMNTWYVVYKSKGLDLTRIDKYECECKCKEIDFNLKHILLISINGLGRTKMQQDFIEVDFNVSTWFRVVCIWVCVCECVWMIFIKSNL